jgi:ubiquinone/menaquinone biosynthesis C-methylase UbiE
LPGGAGWLSHPGGLELTLHAIELAGMKPNARILDIGCGSGESVQFLRAAGLDAFGVDVSLHSTNTGTCLRASASELPFADSSLDGVLVLCECSLSVMKRPAQVLTECARVLRPGGRLMISDLYARAPEAIGAIRRLQASCVAGIMVRAELETWMHEAGFVTEQFEDHSRMLREAAARFILEHDSIETLWATAPHSDAQEIASAMKQVRAGYFLVVAARRKSAE